MPKITIDIPVEIGTTVYMVHDRCHADMYSCPFNGGYGTDRCGRVHEKCGAYYEPVPFSLLLNNRVGEDVFISIDEAQKQVAKLNKVR